MEKPANRVLGRILAVEEVLDVCGAKPTHPLVDNMTTVESDSIRWFDDPQP
ncbi:MAG: hypothetical protein IT473_06925 [Lysobacter sp.]|nr:hypothetical protein [Lysobacter sp.]